MGDRIEDGAKELARRFGRLVAAHRRGIGWSQERLAAEADVSEAMIAKVETGATGARFPMIVRLAVALRVDPAELFSDEIPKGKLQKGPRRALVDRINELDEGQIAWVNDLLAVALRPSLPGERTVGKSRKPMAATHSGKITIRRPRKRAV